MLNPIKIRSEELNKRVTIQRPVKVTNDRGVNLKAYPAYREIQNVCASIESYGAYIRDGTAEKVAELEYRITIRYREGLSLHDRIIYQGRTFEQVLPARDVNERHEFLQLTCREKVK
ncbi:MAG: phage head closure protein [Selenomonadaceae bacterium]|nr:phage head closure protein [Selenomonadaceae bacterium]